MATEKLYAFVGSPASPQLMCSIRIGKEGAFPSLTTVGVGGSKKPRLFFFLNPVFRSLSVFTDFFFRKVLEKERYLVFDVLVGLHGSFFSLCSSDS